MTQNPDETEPRKGDDFDTDEMRERFAERVRVLSDDDRGPYEDGTQSGETLKQCGEQWECVFRERMGQPMKIGGFLEVPEGYINARLGGKIPQHPLLASDVVAREKAEIAKALPTELRPPPEHVAKRWHWVQQIEVTGTSDSDVNPVFDKAPRPMFWSPNLEVWSNHGSKLTPTYACVTSWRYLGPAEWRSEREAGSVSAARAAIFARGMATRKEVKDNITSVAELEALGWLVDRGRSVWVKPANAAECDALQEALATERGRVALLCDKLKEAYGFFNRERADNDALRVELKRFATGVGAVATPADPIHRALRFSK